MIIGEKPLTHDVGRGNTTNVKIYDESFKGGELGRQSNDSTFTTMHGDVSDPAESSGHDSEQNDERNKETNPSEEKADKPIFSDMREMVNAIDDIGRVLDMQRKVVDLKSELENACYQFGISEKDQLTIHEHMKAFTKEHRNINTVTKNKSVLDDTFFKRQDGSIIEIKNSLEKNKNAPGSFNEFEVKKSLVVYVHGFYQFDADVQKDIDEINKSMENFANTDVAGASTFVASSYKKGIESKIEAAMAIEDETMRKKELKECAAMRSAYTFESYIAVLEQYKSIAENSIKDINNMEQVAKVGAAYRKKLKLSGTYSNLFGMIHNDINNSLEAMFLPKDDYAEGYENLFAFGLIRFFSKENWDDPITKQVHNATVILLTNLQKKTLPEDTSESIIAGIRKVWEYFLPSIPKK